MSTTILTPEEIMHLWDTRVGDPTKRMPLVDSDKTAFARAIEHAVLQSEQVQAWKRDAERLDWLADPNNSIGNVQLPTECVTENLHSLRAAIDAAMKRSSHEN